MKKLYWACLGIFLFQGCSGITVTPTKFNKNGSGINYTPVPEEDVKIYTFTKVNGNEFGIVTQEGQDPNVEKIFKSFRKVASDNGAHYVTVFKLKTELRDEMTSSQSCSSGSNGVQGACSTVYKTETKQHFKAMGSLIRKME